MVDQAGHTGPYGRNGEIIQPDTLPTQFNAWYTFIPPVRDVVARLPDKYLLLPHDHDISIFRPNFGNTTIAALRGDMYVSNNNVGKFISKAYETRRKVDRMLNPEPMDELSSTINAYMNEMRKDSKKWKLAGYGSGISLPDALAMVSRQPDGQYLSLQRDFDRMIESEAAGYGVSKRATIDSTIFHELMHLYQVPGGGVQDEQNLETRMEQIASKLLAAVKNAATYSDAQRTRLMSYLRSIQKITKIRKQLVAQNYGGGHEMYYQQLKKEVKARKGYFAYSASQGYSTPNGAGKKEKAKRQSLKSKSSGKK